MPGVGTTARPLRVAIVGSGPSGFFAAAALLSANPTVEIDIIERLPTPFGLVRGGVAPDHQKIKSVARAFERTATQPGVRFLGNVEVGRDVSITQLLQAYDQVVLAIGAESARAFDVPGAALPGCHDATSFVGWYNGHPAFQDQHFNLDVSAAVVVGVGNVAMDVSRILLQDPDALAGTDISSPALAALRKSKIRDVYVLGRRGPAQAAFTPGELKEIALLSHVDLVVRPSDAAVDAGSAAWLDADGDKQAKENVSYLASLVGQPATTSHRLHLRLHTSPVALHGAAHVEQVEVGTNRLVDRNGRLSAEDTGGRDTIAAGLVLTAIGYRGTPLPGVPFDEQTGRIPNRDGQVTSDAGDVDRLYVVGWAKRGPTGLIGTNRADAKATVATMLAHVPHLSDTPRPALSLLGPTVSWDDWKRIDLAEQAAGQARGKIREKMLDVKSMLDVL